MRSLFCSIFFIAAGVLTLAQSPPPTTPPAKDKAAKLPPSPLDKVEGYKRHIIEGFTVMISTEALAGEVKGAEISPMEVVALELTTIKKVMQPKHVALL